MSDALHSRANLVLDVLNHGLLKREFKLHARVDEFEVEIVCCGQDRGRIGNVPGLGSGPHQNVLSLLVWVEQICTILIPVDLMLTWLIYVLLQGCPSVGQIGVDVLDVVLTFFRLDPESRMSVFFLRRAKFVLLVHEAGLWWQERRGRVAWICQCQDEECSVRAGRLSQLSRSSNIDSVLTGRVVARHVLRYRGRERTCAIVADAIEFSIDVKVIASHAMII